MKAFLAARQLVCMRRPMCASWTISSLNRDVTRNVALNVPHWLLVPHVLERTDLIAVMPRRLAQPWRAIARHPQSAVRLACLRFVDVLASPRHEGNPAIAWLRAKLTQVAQALG